MSAQTVTISKLGAQGDGIAYDSDGPIYVPFALPGETVSIARVKSEGTVMSIATPSPDRQEPACRHFGPDGVNGTCGGCTLQHLRDEAYIAQKCDLLATALRRAGFTDVTLSPPVRTRPGERRRMDLAARRIRGGSSSACIDSAAEKSST